MESNERARAVVYAWYRGLYNTHSFDEAVANVEIADVAAAIDAAVAAERERCARVAEASIPSGFTGVGKLGNAFAIARDDRARMIAAQIRGNVPV